MGPLISAYSSSVLFSFGLHLDSKFSQVIQGSFKAWPTVRPRELLEIQSSIYSVIPSGGHDTVTWLPSSLGQFHLASTWNFIRPHNPKIPWFHLVWFKKMIPKHGFISWLVFLDRLTTCARLHKSSLFISPACVFCGSVETRDHLFFSCPFTSLVWSKVASAITAPSLTSWDAVLCWGASLKRKPLRSTICKLG